MPRVEDSKDFVAVSVVGSEYARKWRLEGRPAVYKMYASRYMTQSKIRKRRPPKFPNLILWHLI